MKRVLTAFALAATTAATAIAATGCSQPSSQSDPDPSASQAHKEVVVMSYDSLEFPQEMIDRFHEQTGYDLQFQQVGDAGELTNKLVLTKDNPMGDVAFGVDNISLYRAVKAGALSEDAPPTPSNLKTFPVEGAPGAVAFDYGDVCVNYDKAWFSNHDLQPPANLDDLKDPRYRDLLVTMNPTSSSPGLAFMAATIAQYGDNWVDYWKQLSNNGVKITRGWTEAFNVDYSAGEGKGAYPLMVSYSSSPAWSANDDLTDSSTAAILDTCFRQVEYMAQIQGAANPEGAQAFMKFMLEPEQQQILAQTNYMWPVNPDAEIPPALEKFGPLAPNPHQIDSQTIADNQAQWLRQWAEVVGQ